MRNWRVVLRVVISCISCSPAFAHASEFRILYAEPVDVRVDDTTEAVQAKPGSGRRLSFDAYGRRFDAELEPNTRLLSKLTAERRAELSSTKLYRGTLPGLAGSWVRLAQTDSGFTGAIWDGEDLYALAPHESVARFMVGVSPVTGVQTVVYRLSDVQGTQGGRWCEQVALPASGTGLEAYQAIAGELRAATLQTSGQAVLQLEVAMLGDATFTTGRADPIGAMVTRMNVVDGIFSEQIGVAIVPTDFRLFDAATDPFTGTSPATLLEQLASYREATPEIRDRGLAHLMSGRDLDGSTVGIAFLGSLCEPRVGASLSEGGHDVLTAALIAAHEIGHNFGAPHDGEAGACSATPRTYLMSPILNGSDRFSDCSIGQMQPYVDSASCITAVPRSDIAVEVGSTTLLGSVGQVLDYAVAVLSVGNEPIHDGAVSLRLGNLAVQSAQAEGGSCELDSFEVLCRLGDLPAGDSRDVLLRVVGNQAGTYPTDVHAFAANDQDTSNNSARIDVLLDAPHDARITMVESDLSGYTRDPVAFHVLVESIGTESVEDVTARIALGGLEPLSATVDGVPCELGVSSAICALGSLPAMTSRTITMTASGRYAQYYGLSASVSASNDGSQQNNSDFTWMRLRSAVDVGVEIISSPLTVQSGTPFTLVFSVASTGVQAAEAARATFSLNPATSLSIVDSAGAECNELYPGAIECAFGTLEPGSLRLITATAAISTTGILYVYAHADAPLDDNRDNETQTHGIIVRAAVDVAVPPIDRSFLEGRPANVYGEVRNSGLMATSEVVLDVELAAGVRVQSATLQGGHCLIESQGIRCNLASLGAESSSLLLMELLVDEAGVYEGSIRATTTGDAEPDNDVRPIRFDVRPLIDVGLVSVPERLEVPLDADFGVTVRIATDRRPVDDVSLRIGLPNGSRVVSASGSVGSCEARASELLCTLGDLPAFASVTVDLTLRSSQFGEQAIAVHAYGSQNVISDNDHALIPVHVGALGDVALEIGSTRVTATVDEDFQLPPIIVRGIETTDLVTLDVRGIELLTVVSARVSGGTCSVGASILCALGTVQSGTSRQLDVVLRGPRAGQLQLQVIASGPGDQDLYNNAAGISIIINDKPPEPPPGSGGNGGGGGGSLDWLTLLTGVIWLVLKRAPPPRARALGSVLLTLSVSQVSVAAPPPAAFGQLPAMQNIALSPDGRTLAWQQTSEGQSAIVIFDLSTQQPRRILRWEEGLTLRNIDWADDQTLLYDLSVTHSMYLGSGRWTDEFYRTLAVDRDEGAARVLLMQQERRWVTGARLLATDIGKPQTVMMETLDYSRVAASPTVGKGQTSERKISGWVSTVFEVNTRTGKGRVIERGTPFTWEWVVDGMGRPVARSEWMADSKTFTILARGDRGWRPIYTQKAGNTLMLAGLSRDGEAVVAVGMGQVDRVKAWSIPLDGSAAGVVFEDPLADIDDVIIDPYARTPVGFALAGLEPRVQWIDAQWESRQRKLERTFPERSVQVLVTSRDGRRVVVEVSDPSHPPAYHLVDFDRSSATMLGEAYPGLVNFEFGKVQPVRYAARDGAEIPAYLTLPAGQTAASKVPLVVLPHGGPEAHDRYEFNWWTQFFASRGYAVLQPQFRGSTGFGESHRLAGRRQWGKRMQDDVTDGVKAMVDRGVTSPGCVCIVGASYGGYAALAGAAFTPEVFACAASVNGISDLPAMLGFVHRQYGEDSDTWPYWKEQLGPTTDPVLAQVSPIHSAANIKAAVLLMHGSEDTIVPAKQSEGMAAALDAAGKSYRYVRLPGEDHWLSSSETRIHVLTELESFLESSLHSACSISEQK